MSEKKTTASGIVFNSAVHVMADVIDFTIKRHEDDQAAMQIYCRMKAAMAESRRRLRDLLKKSWIRGKEREKLLARARELREAEIIIGYMRKTAVSCMEANEAFLNNIKHIGEIKELMSRFTIKCGKKK